MVDFAVLDRVFRAGSDGRGVSDDVEDVDDWSARACARV